MNNTNIAKYVIDTKVLHYLYDQARPALPRWAAAFSMVLAIPLITLVLASRLGVARLPSDQVGLLDDYLYLAFAFVVVPLALAFLRLILVRFNTFMVSLPEFTSIDAERHARMFALADDMIVGYSRYKTMIILRYLLAFAALYSNLRTITVLRPDGWDSLTYPVFFGLTAVYLSVVLVFIIAPLIEKFLLVVAAQIRITYQMGREDLVVVRPLSPDNCGGLKTLGELSLSFTYFLLPFSAILLSHYYTWGAWTIGLQVGIALFIPIIILVFLFPLGAVHRAMSQSKHKALFDLSDRFIMLSERFISSSHHELTEEPLRDNLETVRMLYEQVSRMPVWPFDLKMISRLFAIALGPLVVIGLQMGASWLIKNVLLP